METRAPYALLGLFVLAVIAAVFGFVYWLHNTAGLGERTIYRVRYENTVAGLLKGAAVLFNGIRVGEVTELTLDPANPNQVTVTIAVVAGTPVRPDTKASLDFQGLTGVPVVTLEGGSAPPAARTTKPGEPPPLLVADPLAGQSMTQAAREALRRVDAVLAENAEPLRNTIANLKTFSEALARNSDRLDGIVAGVERMTGGGQPAGPLVTYDLTAPRVSLPSVKPDQGQIVVAEPTSMMMFETRKIPLRPDGKDEDPSFANAQWPDSVPKLLQSKIVQSFENAGLLRTTAKSPTDGVAADHQLLIDIRSFHVSTAPQPVAEIEFAAKILSDSGKIVDARVFRATAPAKGTDAAAAAAALNEAFGTIARELVVWTAGAV